MQISARAEALQQKFGTVNPVVLAPLAGGPCTPSLVAAVTEAGGFGFLAGAYLHPEALHAEVEATRALTRRPFGVNLFLPCSVPPLTDDARRRALALLLPHFAALDAVPQDPQPPYHPDFESQLRVVLQARPRAVSFIFGAPSAETVRRCHHAGVNVVGTATSLPEAREAMATGVDVVCLQGVQAGGHRGTFEAEGRDDPAQGTSELVRLVRAETELPLIAAGGMMHGADVAHVLRQGADAAQLGTAFLAGPEAGTAAPYRAALTRAGARPTDFTRVFSGRRARGLINALTRATQGHEDALLPFPAQNALTRPLRAAAVRAGNAQYLSLWAGTGVERIRTLSADTLVRNLTAELAEALASV